MSEEREQRLEKVIQRLEDQVLQDSSGLHLRGETKDSPHTSVPAKVREIITKSLASEDGSSQQSSAVLAPTAEHLMEENRMLQLELNRIGKLLAATSTERDALRIKYNGVSKRLDAALHGTRGDTEDSPDDFVASEGRLVMQQNAELRDRLEDERLKVRSHMDTQRQQACIVQKLQAEVLQYKTLCLELEGNFQSAQTNTDLTRMSDGLSVDGFDSSHEVLRLHQVEADHSMTMDTLLVRLEEEQHRNIGLTHTLDLLRDQLDSLMNANRNLATDLEKQKAQCERLKDRAAEWTKEEQSFGDYFRENKARLLNVWNAIGAFRCQFDSLKSATQHDLSQLKSDFVRLSQNARSACLNLDTNVHKCETQNALFLEREKINRSTVEKQLLDKKNELVQLQSELNAQSIALNDKVRELTNLNERVRSQLTEEECNGVRLKTQVTQLESKIESLNKEFLSANSSKPSASDFNSLISTLQRIADDALNDFNNSSSHDLSALDLSASDLHALRRSESRSPIRNSSRTPSYSLVRGGHELSPAMESAFRTVQKALHERRLQVDELKAKISAMQDQAESRRRQVERLESEKRHLELSMSGLKSERSQLVSSQHDLQHTIDQLRRSLEASVSENERLEQLRQTLVSKLEEVNGANQRLHAANTELRRLRNQLEDEKNGLSKERDRQIKDKELSRQQTEEAVAKASKLKEELVDIKESHKKTVLDLEMLSHEKDEIKNAFTRAELSKSELELDLNKFRSEASCLRDDLLKLRALNDGLSQDKAELNAMIVQLEEERVSLDSHRALAEQERNGLHDRLLRLERDNMDLETEKSGLQNAIQLSEQARAQLEDEVHQLNHIRADLSKQLTIVTRQKTLLAEQLVIVEGDLERQTDAIVRVTKDKEEMNILHRELAAQIVAAERESSHKNEMIASLNIEKEDLESNLYDIQQLEAERQELLLKNESLTAEVEKLRCELHETAETSEQQREVLHQRLIAVEKDNQCFQQDLRHEKDLHDDDVRRITQELEKVCAKLEAERNVMVGQFAHDRDSILADTKAEKEQLLRELSAMKHDRDDQVISAENQRKELLARADQERSSFQEKIALLERDLAFSGQEKQELHGQIDRHLRTVESLQSEMRSVKTSFGQTIEMREKESKSLNQQLNDLARQRDSALNNVNELKMKLHLMEEARERLEHDLGQVNRKFQEADEAKELLQKQILNLKCNLSEETYEKEAIQKTSDDVCSLLKKAEAEKLELTQKIQDFKQKLNILDGQKTGAEMEATDLRTSLRAVEKARQEARNDIHENRTRIKMLTADRDRLTQSLEELQDRLGKAELREENSQKEIHQLRQKLLDSGKDRESMQKDNAAVKRRLADGENHVHLKDRDFKLVVEDRERGVAHAEDQRRLLEAALERSKADIEENRVRLSASEGKVQELENKLAEVEAENHDMEMKLASVVSTLRKTIGYNPTARGRSRNRSSTPLDFSSADFDLESMRVAIREHVDQSTMVEHERDESLALLRSSQAHISDLEEENLGLLNHVEQLKTLLESVEEGKREIDGQLNDTQSTLVVQSESLRRSEREQKHLSSRSDGLEWAVAALEAEKRQLQEKLNKAKGNEKRLEVNRRTTAGHLGEAENHLTKAELVRRSLESEIQHLKMALNDKETEKQVINNRAEHLVQQIENLEDKAQSLQTTIDRLSNALICSSEERNNHKDHVQALNFSLSDRSTTISGRERLALILKTLASSEQDRRFLQENLENVIRSLKEAIRNNETLTERFRVLQAELSDCNMHRAELETQLNQSHDMLLQRQDNEEQLNGKIQRLITDKQSMQEIIATLQRNLAKLGAEKRKAEMSAAHLEKDRNTLKKDLNKRNGVLTKASMENSSLDWSLRHLEEENMKLLHEVQALQLQLTDAEQSHAKRLGELIARHRQESSLESDRLLSAKLQTEKLLEVRERAHRQHIKTSEEQILTLKDELKHVIRMSRAVRGSHSPSDLNETSSLGTGPNFLDHKMKKPNGIVEHNRRSTSPGKTPGFRRSSPVRTVLPTNAVQAQSRGSSPMRSAFCRNSPSPVPTRSTRK